MAKSMYCCCSSKSESPESIEKLLSKNKNWVIVIIGEETPAMNNPRAKRSKAFRLSSLKLLGNVVDGCITKVIICEWEHILTQ